MKKLSFFVALITLLVAGCATTSDQLVMERTVKIKDYAKTVDEMAEEIERNNTYEANDVQTTIYGDRVTIRVIAEKMRLVRRYEKCAERLQNENASLKRKISELEKQIKDSQLVPVTVSTNGSVSVDLRNVRSKTISVY